MKFNKLASVILRGTFLIDTRAAQSLIPIAQRFLNGETVTWFDGEPEKKKKFLETYVVTKENSRRNLKAQQQQDTAPEDFYSDAPDGSVAIIPISGPLMMDDFCSTTGTATLCTWLMAALASPNIIGAVLHTNCPGGTVEGTAEFAECVNTVASLMPVEVYCDGQLCSAAYWFASQATRITASSGTVEIGCIGTAGNWKDYSAGSQVVTHYVTADASFDKNQESIQVFKGNYELVKNSIINPTNDIFLSSIKSGRGDKLQLTDVKNDAGEVIGQYPLTGQVYLAGAAMELGLIDAIGNRDTVLENIRQTYQTSTSNQFNMNIFGRKSNFKALSAIKEKKAADITEAEIVAINDEFTEAGYENIAVISADHLEEAHNNADALSAGLTALNTSLNLTGAKAHTTVKAAITALIADRDAEYDRAEAYGDQPGERPSNPKTKAKTEGGNIETKEMTSYQAKMAKKQAQFKTVEDAE